MEVERPLPMDIESEEAYLGAILVDANVMKCATLEPGDFYSPRNGDIYRAMRSLQEKHQAVNQVTVATELKGMGKLKDIGGAAFMSHLISVCPTSLDAASYVEIIKQHSTRRRLIAASDQVATLGYREDLNSTLAMTQAEGILTTLRKSDTSSKIITPKMAGQKLIDLTDKYKEPCYAPAWGFRVLDDITAGILPEYIIIGARPSVGKTQLMLDIADNVVSQGKKCLFCSLEMSMEQLLERKMARELGISILDIRRNGIREDRITDLLDLSGKIAEQPLHYLAEGSSLADIRRETETMLAQGELGAIFIDYLGLLKDCWIAGGRETKQEKVGRVSKIIKDMVKTYKIPVIVASQMNRNSEQDGKSRPPTMAELRDSGELEQDADVVFLAHRVEDEFGVKSTVLKLGMEKNRQLGWHGPVELFWDEKNHRYCDNLTQTPKPSQEALFA